MKIGQWKNSVAVTRNYFVNKSLSSWACNIAVGCKHGCVFCYVPEVSTIKLAGSAEKPGPLRKLGVEDADKEWGDYVFPRFWNREHFERSVRDAERTAVSSLNKDGNRAVMFCTTTDPYQTLTGGDHETRTRLNKQLLQVMEDALTIILERSTLNVRVLTRSPLARVHFDLMKKFGNRLMFGMSLPTLRSDLAELYEPSAPAPGQRMATLLEAKKAGLHVFVAVAPTLPEMTGNDIIDVTNFCAELEPLTVFMEPINIRADNVQRMKDRAAALKMDFKAEVFETPQAWRQWNMLQLLEFDALAASYPKLAGRVHLWPDAALGTKEAVKQLDVQFALPGDKFDTRGWLGKRWSRVSEWPT